jgi:O-antigen/teichoic acid export membrane protein
MRQVAWEYIKFPKYSMPTGALNSISQNFPVLLFAYLFSQEVVGFYGLANMVLRRPIALMSQSLSKVFLQKSAEVENKGGTHFTNLKKTTLGLVIIGIMPFTVLTFFGGRLFGLIFGSQWVIAGGYAQILAPWLFLLFINKPANGIYIVKKKLRFMFYFNIISIISRLAAIVGGYQIIPKPWFAIAIFSTVGILTNIYFIYYAFSISKR